MVHFDTLPEARRYVRDYLCGKDARGCNMITRASDGYIVGVLCVWDYNPTSDVPIVAWAVNSKAARMSWYYHVREDGHLGDFIAYKGDYAW